MEGKSMKGKMVAARRPAATELTGKVRGLLKGLKRGHLAAPIKRGSNGTREG